MRSIIVKIFPVVGMDNEINYSECTRNVPKFSYNIVHKVLFGLSLNEKYLCKYFFGIRQLKITLLPNKIRVLSRLYYSEKGKENENINKNITGR